MKQGFDWETKVSRDRPSLDPSHRVLGLFPIKLKPQPADILCYGLRPSSDSVYRAHSQ